MINLDKEIKRISDRVDSLRKLLKTTGNIALLSAVIDGYDNALICLDNCKKFIDKDGLDNEINVYMTKYYLNDYKDIMSILEPK